MFKALKKKILTGVYYILLLVTGGLITVVWQYDGEDE